MDGPQISTIVANEVQVPRKSWPPMAAGFFGGSFERFERAQDTFLKVILSPEQWI